MKRHLLVTNDFPPKVGGIQNYLWDLWSRLDPASFVVLTASSDDDAASFDAAQAARGVRIERVPGSILFFPTPQARRAVERLRARPRHRPRAPRPRVAPGTARPAPRRPLWGCPPRRRSHRPGPPARAACRAGAACCAARPSSFPPDGIRPPRAAASYPIFATPFVEIPPGVDTAAVVSAQGARPSGRPGRDSGCPPPPRCWPA